MIHLVWGHGAKPARLRAGGGLLGQALSSALTTLVSSLGAFVVLLGLIVAGLLLMFNTSLRDAAQPGAGGGRMLAGARRQRRTRERGAPMRDRAAEPGQRASRASGRAASGPSRSTPEAPDLPTPERTTVPLSQTIWTGRAHGWLRRAATATAVARAPPPTDVDDTGDEPGASSGTCPDSTCSTRPASPPVAASDLDHARNIRIIEEKLASFQIPAQVVATNTGPSSRSTRSSPTRASSCRASRVSPTTSPWPSPRAPSASRRPSRAATS